MGIELEADAHTCSGTRVADGKLMRRRPPGNRYEDGRVLGAVWRWSWTETSNEEQNCWFLPLEKRSRWGGISTREGGLSDCRR